MAAVRKTHRSRFESFVLNLYSFEPAPPVIFVAHVRRGLTAITVATGRKRLVDATRERSAFTATCDGYLFVLSTATVAAWVSLLTGTGVVLGVL